jgi:phosphoglycerate dehydrogenase-like enzyme
MRIAILDDYQHVAGGYADWESLGADVTYFDVAFATETDVVEALAGFDVLVAMRERTKFPAHVLRALPDLKLLVTTGRGNASIDVATANELGVVVCGTDYPRMGSTPELTWGLILAWMRNIPTESRRIVEGGWQSTLGVDLEGKVLGLLGLGNIGVRVARVGLAFGMEVIAWSENLTSERAAEHRVAAVSKHELFGRSDVVSVHVILSDRSRGLVGAPELAAMKSSALLVNTSRGPIIDERALVTALRDDSIGGAALDVFDTEPLPVDHELRRLSNTLLTPHLGYVTEDAYAVFYAQAVEDIAAFQAGAPLRIVVPRTATPTQSPKHREPAAADRGRFA